MSMRRHLIGCILVGLLTTTTGQTACRNYSSFFLSGSAALSDEQKAVMGQKPDFCFEAVLTDGAKAALQSELSGKMARSDIKAALGEIAKATKSLEGFSPVDLDRVEFRVRNPYPAKPEDESKTGANVEVIPCADGGGRNLCVSVSHHASAAEIKNLLTGQGYFVSTSLFTSIFSRKTKYPVQAEEDAAMKSVVAEPSTEFAFETKSGTIVPPAH